jgi:hypothetical protein
VELLTLALMVWAFAYAVENAKSQWRHTRDQHTRAISRQHPTWHPRKVRRHADWRALAWWAHEARDGFPSIRNAWAEDREHVRFLREQELVSQEARLGEWRAALADIRARRAAHAAAVERGETTVSFGQWYRQAGPGTGREPGQSGNAGRSGETVRQNGGAQAGDGQADAGRAPVDATRGEDNGQPAGQDAAADTGDAGYRARHAAEESRAALRDGRAADAVTALGRYQSARDQLRAASAPGSPGGPGLPGPDMAGVRASQAGPGGGRPQHSSGAGRHGGRSAPTGSGQQAGGSDSNLVNGGKGMGMPNGELAGDSPYRSALTAMDGYDQVAAQHEQAAETLEAQLTLHGFDRDQGLMEHIRALRETASQIRAHTAGARQVLVDHHATGDEYHTSGVDAEASAFRH